eukprot:jgi/Botrbrau1/23633/Bobra.55_2s0020.2
MSRSGFSREQIMREMSLLMSCRNSNIVQFLGVCHRRDSVWLVMEYMPGGDLRSFVNLQEDWSWGPRAAQLALDISRGLAYLHAQRVIHMDLKSSNVLLTSGGRAKVSDVGMAHILAESRTHGSNLEMGTFTYAAPEMILYGMGGWSADIYSFGVILWELVTGKVPVRGRMRKLRAPEDCPEAVAQLVEQCTASDPLLRPTAKHLAQMLEILASDSMSMLPASRLCVDDPDCPDSKSPTLVHVPLVLIQEGREAQ